MCVDVEELEILRRNVKDVRTVATRADQLEQLASSLRDRTSRLRLYRDHGLRPHILREKPQSLLDITRSHRSKFDSDRSSITIDPEDSGFKWNYLRELERLIKLMDRALDTAWQDHVRSLVPAGLDEQLVLLGGAGVMADQIQRMRELAHELVEAQSRTAMDADTFRQVRALARELNDLWKTLSGIPEDIRAFLAAASTDGAPIDALTPEVRNWLTEKGFFDSLRVVLKGET